MNKKILAILMALLMVLTSVAAFAEGEVKTKLTITKDYTLTGTEENPTETLTFTATNVKYTAPDGTVTDGAKADPITATLPTNVDETAYNVDLVLPTITEAGVYLYTVTETAGSIQGAGYDDGSFDFNILATYVEGTETVQITDVQLATAGDDGKIGGFVNTYAVSETANALTLACEVTGNAGDITDEFEVTLTFTTEDGKNFDENFDSIMVDGEEVAVSDGVATITIKDGDALVITGVPVDATITVAETDSKVNQPGAEAVATKYDVKYDADDEATAGTAETITITNERNTEIATGVFTDNMPYFMLMAFVMILAAAVVLKKRTVNE